MKKYFYTNGKEQFGAFSLEELKNKEKLLDVRLKSLETQEESLLAQSKTIRKQNFKFVSIKDVLDKIDE